MPRHRSSFSPSVTKVLRTSGETRESACPFPHGFQQCVYRRLGKKTIELRAIVIHETDILGDNVVNLPFAVDFVQPVYDGIGLAVAVGKSRLDFGIIAVDRFAGIDHFLAM